MHYLPKHFTDYSENESRRKKYISKVKLNQNMPYYDHGWQYLVVYIYTSQSRGPFNKDL